MRTGLNPKLSYGLSVVLAVAFHAGVVGLLLMNWEESAAIEVSPIQPLYIDAVVVKENPIKARERKEAEVARQRNEARTARVEREKQARLKQEAIDRARQQELEAALARQREEEAKAKLDTEQQVAVSPPDETDETDERERRRMEQSLALAILEEQEFRRAVTDDEKAMAYVAQIQREIIQNWSRPPSARNGMEVILRVFLVPTGEVVNVVVEDGSGNEAFDRSALLAVQKAERFQVPDDPRQFERNFREFTVLFRPEDLRL